MKWGDIGDAVGRAAPLLGTALGGPAGGAIGAMIASLLGVEAEPAAVGGALAADPAAAAKLRELEMAHQHELRLAVLQSETARLGEINATMRAEYAANDAFVRRWRPYYGYMVATTWGLQTLAIAAAIVWASFITPEYAGEILGAVTALVGALAAHWGVALAVLGVNVAQRSRDKQVQAGQEPPPGILGALATRLAGAKP